MECMANSDNVIRAGLTPKLRDIPNLVAGLTYVAAEPEKHVVEPTPYLNTTHTRLYNPPIPEFSVLFTQLRPHESESHDAIDGPSICIVTEGASIVRWDGEGAEMRIGTGDVIFVGAGRDVKFDTVDDEGLTVFRAFVTVDT
jgi:mannose-6-phosphate isomerase